MRVIVTGAAGFIGSHLTDRLLADGHEVLAIDDLSTGRRANLPMDHPRMRLWMESVQRANPLEHYDWVFHLAAKADIVPSIEQPRAYHEANVHGTVAALEIARSVGAARFVYVASSSCYGQWSATPTPEDAPLSPQYPYALMKMVGEQYARHWMQVYGLPVVSLRLFNVYGPRHRTSGAYGAVMGVFLAQKANGQPLTVVGDGTQRRDFTHVSDVVDALVKAAESDVTGVFNVGSGEAPSINDLAALCEAPVVHIPSRPGEPDCTLADTRKIRRALGWGPRVAFPTGVRDLLARLDEWKSAPVWTPETIAIQTASWHRYLTAAVA